MSTILELIKDFIHTFVYFFESNLVYFAKVLNFVLPYAMYAIGQYVHCDRGKFAVGGEFFVPIAVCIIIYFMKSYANKIGKGTSMPIPGKRFTEVDDDEVSVDHKRLQELLLYTADLEDWLERKGLL